MKYPKLKDRKRSEKEITQEIRAYMNFKGIYHWKVFSGPMSKAGVSDILGILPGGRLLAVEVKTEKGVMTDRQAAFLNAVKIRGGMAIMARSARDVEIALLEGA